MYAYILGKILGLIWVYGWYYSIFEIKNLLIIFFEDFHFNKIITDWFYSLTLVSVWWDSKYVDNYIS